MLVLLRLAPKKGAEELSTPSAMVPAYQKENKSRRHKKPGRKAGHPGSHRPVPDHVDRTEERRAECCPDCGGKLKRRNVTRERYVEDIPQDIKPEVVKNVIYRDWCPKCRKVVSGRVPDALPGSSVGLRILILTAFWHYMVGNTLSRILTTTSSLFSFKLKQGGLHHRWNRLADYLRPW